MAGISSSRIPLHQPPTFADILRQGFGCQEGTAGRALARRAPLRILVPMRIYLTIICLLLTGPVHAGGQAIGRLAFYDIPSERMQEFDAHYSKLVAPYLDSLGLTESEESLRMMVETVYARLYDFSTVDDLHHTSEMMTSDLRWQEVRKELGSAFSSIADEGLIRAPDPQPIRLYASFGVKGRTVPLGPGKRTEVGSYRGKWRHFGQAEGLSALSVRCFYEDQEGSLWLGTTRGVTRYKGGKFQTFEIEGSPERSFIYDFFENEDRTLWVATRKGVLAFDGFGFIQAPSQGLPDGHVHEFVQDRAKNVWVSTHGGVSRFDGSSWKAYGKKEGLPEDDIRGMIADRRGRIWFVMRQSGSYLGGVGLYEEGRVRELSDEGAPVGIQVNSVMEDADGHIWVGTTGALFEYDGTEWRRFSSGDGLPESRTFCPFQDSHGRVWFHAEDSGAGFVERGVVTRFAPPDRPALGAVNGGFVEDALGHVWFATQGGAVRFDGQDWQVFTAAEGLSEDSAASVFGDREGRIWISGNGGTLSRYDATTWRHFTALDGLGTNSVARSTIDDAGNLWFGTNGGGVSRITGEALVTYTAVDGIPHNWVRQVWKDPTGGTWFGTQGGFGRLDWEARTITNFTHREGLPSSRASHRVQGQDARAFAWDDRGRLLVSLRNHRVVRLDGDRMDHLDRADGIESNKVSTMLTDRNGVLWFGENFFGRVIRRSSDDVRVFDEEDGVPDAWVRDLLQDRNGDIWIATWGGGVCRYDGTVIQVLTHQDGLASDFVRSMFEDQVGHLWFGTQAGASRYDHQTVSTIDKRDGLSGNDVRSIVQDRKGDFWFSTNEGVTQYRQPPKVQPTVELSAIVADRRIDDLDDLAFPSTVGLLSFEFDGASHATRPDNLIFRYRLQGYEDWQVTRSRRVEYDGLPRGDYALELQSVDRDLVYSDILSVPFTIYAPYRQIALVTGLILALGIVALQGARLVRRDQRLRVSNSALSDANKELFQVNVDIQREQVLERLRGQAQGMQSSEDIKPVVEAVNRELTGLGLPMIGASIGIHLSDTATELWVTGEDGRALEPFVADPSNVQLREAQRRGGNYDHWHREGEELKEQLRLAAARGNPRALSTPEEQWPNEMEDYAAFFEGGRIRVMTGEPITEDYLMLIRRFGEVFGYAHSRWEELKQKEAQNQRLAVEASVQRLRAEVQSMDEASDFERILSLLTESLKTVELTFDGCEIDVLDEPVENPTMEMFQASGFRYTTYTLDPNGRVASEAFAVPAPFPTVNRRTIERFIAGEPWQGTSEGEAIVEVPAGAYGRLRLTATDRQNFDDDEVATLREFADAVALGYARYLDIREIQEATERKSAFLASMSHELRTPMNAIKGFTNLVLNREGDKLSERGQGNLQKATQASDHLLAMIDDLLDLSKIEAGSMDVNPERFDVRELVTSACDTVSPLIQEGVELRQDVADNIGEANTDKARLQQMVINLLSNAIKFTDSGSVTVTASRGPSSAEATAGRQGAGSGGEDLVISVSDTGKGIPADELPTHL